MSMTLSAWRSGRLAAAACCAAVASAAGAQIVGSGAPSGGAGVSEMGQNPSFQNVTTTFQDISFRTRALIRDPGDNTKFRLIAQLENTGAKDTFVALVGPAASLIDDMANVYERAGETGLDYCRNGNRIEHGGYYCNERVSVTLAPGLPAPVSFVFAPHSSGGFQPELAALATTARLSVTFAVATDDFASPNDALVHEVQVTDLPIPQ